MKFYSAQVADIFRCSLRDRAFINELENQLISLLKSVDQKKYNQIKTIVPHISTTWYYLLTSLSNLQTLGEEYTGTIRVNNNKIPSKYWHLLWLIFYVGGESLFDRIISHWENKIHTSHDLKDNIKKHAIKITNFLKSNKDLLIRLHHSIFYINGGYYNTSNRITGIKYVLIRQWMLNDAASKSFKLLGKVSLIYVVLSLIKNFRTENLSNEYKYPNDGNKMCILCVENRSNACATLCGHLFCWKCINDSLKYQRNCPICREAVQPSRLIFLQNYQ